jgi:putative NADH-flavin reductase
MKLLVLGATGGTGLEIVRQALDHGHTLTAFVRSTERLQAFDGRIAIRQGSLLDRTQLEQVLPGHDAILSAFGPRIPLAKEDCDLMRRFAIALTSAMARAGTQRVIVESVAFLFKNSVMPPAYPLGRLFFPRTVRDAAGMERIFAESGLDWTMVRPPELTDKPFTGKYRVREGHLPIFGFKISRADVADFMIRVTEEGSFLRRIAGLAN